MQYLADGSWLLEPMTEADARRLVVHELGGTWTQTRVDGAEMAANTMVHAWNAGDLTMREADDLLRHVAGSGPRPKWLADLAEWKRTYLQP